MRKRPQGFHRSVLQSFQNFLNHSWAKKTIDFLNPIAHFGEREDNNIFVSQSIPFFVFIFLEIIIYIPSISSEGTTRTLVIFTLLVTVIYSSIRNGRLFGVLSSFLCGIYILYAFSRLSPLFQYTSTREKNAIIIFIFFLVVAITVGWLREKINSLFNSEREIRNEIEVESVHLEAMLRQLPAGVLFIKARTGKIILANNAMEEIFQTPSPYITNIKNYDHIMIKKKNGKVVRFSQLPTIQALRRGKVTIDEEFQIIRNNKSVAFVKVNATPILDKNNRVSSAVAVFDNITTLKDVELLKDEFISIMSHELKAPMTSLKGYAQILKKQAQRHQDEKMIHFIKKIEDQSSRMSGLINDMLDISRIQTGKMSINKEVFDLTEVIADTTDAFSQTTRMHTIEFEKTQPNVITADRFRIYQVFSNLLSNAIKYSPSGGKIIVTIKRETKDIVVRVKDPGIGLSKEQEKKVFEKLYQAATPKRNRFPGLGMGLYISKEIVMLHKGKIWVESEKNKGSTFFFSLPIEKTAPGIQKA